MLYLPHEIFLVLFIWHFRCRESQKISVNKDQGTETVLSQIDQKIVIFCFSDELTLKNIRSDRKQVRMNGSSQSPYTGTGERHNMRKEEKQI